MSKATMARRKRMLAEATVERDAWLCGYAAALAAVQRLYRESQIVESVIRSDGLSPERLMLAGVESFDMRQIRKAWTRRNGDAPRGCIKVKW